LGQQAQVLLSSRDGLTPDPTRQAQSRLRLHFDFPVEPEQEPAVAIFWEDRQQMSTFLRMAPWMSGLVIVGCELSFSSALADERGWLKYRDGNVLSGSLIESTQDGGIFESDRFGEVRYAKADAGFNPAGPQRAADSTSPPADVHKAEGWAPDKWTLAFAADWKHENSDVEYDVAGDLSAYWNRPRDDASLTMRVDYKIRNERLDNNVQNARLRWFHTVDSPWLVFTQLYAEHDRIDLAGRQTGYELVQASLGPGARVQWNEDSYSRLAIAFNRFAVEIPTVDLRAYDTAASIFADNRIKLTSRLSFHNWLNVYWWGDDGTLGIESEAELDYAVTRQISLGIWHRYKERGADIHDSSVNELRLFTRVTF
jgi:Protein of unknown function, DUF481